MRQYSALRQLGNATSGGCGWQMRRMGLLVEFNIEGSSTREVILEAAILGFGA